MVRGADQLGETLGPRFQDAFDFLGRALAPHREDPALPALHRMIASLRRVAGLD